MPKGTASPVGTETINQNGYRQRKTKNRGWVAVHVLLMEQKLGRKLEPNEFVKFKDGRRSNLHPDNLELRVRGDAKSPQARLAAVEARIEELQAEAEELRQQISRESASS